jgi:cytochrome c oxidase subunit 3
MATTIQQPPKVDEPRGPARGAGDEGGPRPVKDHTPPPASTGMWVVLASITMTFAAFTSALIVRQGSANDWTHLSLPPILYLNTLVLIASSVALEIARRQIDAYMKGPRDQSAPPSRWLYITLGLGLFFVAGQYVAWLQLRARGLFLASNPNSSFFYVLTGIHALHVSGGLGGLVRVIRRLNKSVLRKSTLDATSHYWHFMDALWVYLLLLLWIRL